MDTNSRDREDRSGADREGAAGTGVELAAAPDIFLQVARNVFLTRNLPVDEAWAEAIAEEYRIAMAELDVQLKPKGPTPKPTRTTNGAIMLLLAGLENGDLWVRDCAIEARKLPNGTSEIISPIVRFDAGLFHVEVQYHFNRNAASCGVVEWNGIRAFQLPHGQRVIAGGPARTWLLQYRPMPECDGFSGVLQTTLDRLERGAWPVESQDTEGRTWRWRAGQAYLYRDARGRRWPS